MKIPKDNVPVPCVQKNHNREGTCQKVNTEYSVANLCRRRLFIAISGILLIICLYFASVIYRTYTDYKNVKQHSRGWSVPVHKADAKLGWRPIPLKESSHIFPTGPDIPTAFDVNGFRRPLDEYSSPQRIRPYILSLGCSFTYGDACLAEDTFSYKVAKAFGGTELNAGICGIGLAQMVLLAEELIPKYKPEYVVVQYSPWLVERSMGYFGPTYYSYIPLPFFAEDMSKEVVIMPPIFTPVDFDMSYWLSSSRGTYDYLRFLYKIGIPLNIYDDFHLLRYYMQYNLGRIKKPLMNKNKALEYSYGTIKKICETENSSMLVVVLGWSSEDTPIPDVIEDIHIPIVNCHEELLSCLRGKGEEISDETYYNAYGHLRGTPPELVDIHPNAKAHSIIASCISEFLLQNKAK